MTAFLSCWVYEELWHGEAFSDFLRAYGIEVPAEPKLPDGSTPMPTRPNRVTRLRTELGVGHQLSLAADDARVRADEGLRRDPHGVGSDQRADDADRLSPADQPLGASRAAPDAAPGHPGRAAPLRVLPRAGQGAARGRAAPLEAAGALGVPEPLDPGRRGGQEPGGGRRARAVPVRRRARGPRGDPRARRHDRRDPGPRGPAPARGRARRCARPRAGAAGRAGRSARSSRCDPRGRLPRRRGRVLCPQPSTHVWRTRS